MTGPNPAHGARTCRSRCTPVQFSAQYRLSDNITGWLPTDGRVYNGLDPIQMYERFRRQSCCRLD